MHLPKREQCFAAFKSGNDHILQFDSYCNCFIVNYCVVYQLVTLLGNYIHWCVKWVTYTSQSGKSCHCCPPCSPEAGCTWHTLARLRSNDILSSSTSGSCRISSIYCIRSSSHQWFVVSLWTLLQAGTVWCRYARLLLCKHHAWGSSDYTAMMQGAHKLVLYQIAF